MLIYFFVLFILIATSWQNGILSLCLWGDLLFIILRSIDFRVLCSREFLCWEGLFRLDRFRLVRRLFDRGIGLLDWRLCPLLVVSGSSYLSFCIACSCLSGFWPGIFVMELMDSGDGRDSLWHLRLWEVQRDKDLRDHLIWRESRGLVWAWLHFCYFWEHI